MPLLSRLRWLPFLLLPVALAACGSPLAASPTATAPPSARSGENSLAPPRTGAYAALGASETYGIGATPNTDGYAYLVAKSLHARHFVDVGIPGTTVADGYDAELTNALAIRPQLCTVFFGVNDIRAGVSRSAFTQNLHDLVATLRQARCRVLIIGIPDLAHVPAVAHSNIGDLGGIVTSWNNGMREVARQTGSSFLDLRQFSAELAFHPEYIAADGLHPSNAGHARLAQVVAAAVRQDGLWKTP